MKLLVTGARGQLGGELLAQGPPAGWRVVGVDLPELDICDGQQVGDLLAAVRPDILINAAAYTAVDRAEAEEPAADRVNRLGADRLAAACAAADVALVHISTDFVFDGRLRRPYTENDPVAPLSVYGRTKAAGEAAVRARWPRHLIVRTAWLYSVRGENFVRTMLALGRQRRELRVVADQYGSPTGAADLAAALLTCARLALTADGPWGTYHYCGAGVTTWHGLAEAVFAAARPLTPLAVERVCAITTDQYPTAARRPVYSALDCSRIGRRFGIHPPAWRRRVAATVAQIVAMQEATANSGTI